MLCPAQPASAQDESDQRLGRVHFVISCNETAQRRFDRAMRYQHSFWYRQAKEIFEDVAKADPECGMAYWGIALTLLNYPPAANPASNLPLGLAAIEKAKAVGITAVAFDRSGYKYNGRVKALADAAREHGLQF